MTIYRDHYGLIGDPFHVTPDFSMLLLTKSHREALGALDYGLHDRKGVIVVTGEVGTGKTTVLRACLDRLARNGDCIIYIFEPRLDTRELYIAILETLLQHVGPAATTEDRAPKPLSGLLGDIQAGLLRAHASGITVILALDEAQHIAPHTLESLRLLSNLETAKDKLLQIVLVGQPELDDVLGRHDLRQLEQRIAVRANIVPLSWHDSQLYIRHRLQMAGWHGSRDLFTRPARTLLAWRARGIPRLINMLCDNAMVNDFGLSVAPVKGGRSHQIGIWTVMRSVPGAARPRHQRSRRRPLLAGAVALAALVAIVAASQRLNPNDRISADATSRSATAAARAPALPEPISPIAPMQVTASTAAPTATLAAIQMQPSLIVASTGAAVAAPPGPGADATSETVAAGDSLSRICARLYGRCTSRTLRSIVDSNGLQHPDLLFQGQVVVFPLTPAGE